MHTQLGLPSLTVLEAAVGEPVGDWSHRCHEISLAIVRSGVLETPCRVARGTCRGVPGQHSWVVLGMDCYADPVTVVDPTLWSYTDFKGIFLGSSTIHRHSPHGMGNIWQWGRPESSTENVIELAVTVNDEAKNFLRLIGPLDDLGWQVLLHAPVLGWPSAEIISAAYQTPELRQYIPIDIVGMLTEHNPGKAYLA